MHGGIEMKIYVASSWRNAYQPLVVETLREAGHEVYDFRNPAPGDPGFSWAEIDPYWTHWTVEEFQAALKHPIAVAAFGKDMGAMERADACVMVLPCGRSAHTEMGWFTGRGKLTIIYAPIDTEPELMYKQADDHVYGTLVEVLEVLRENS